MANFDELPVEVLGHVFYFLSFDQLIHFRCVSRQCKQMVNADLRFQIIMQIRHDALQLGILPNYFQLNELPNLNATVEDENFSEYENMQLIVQHLRRRSVSVALLNNIANNLLYHLTVHANTVRCAHREVVPFMHNQQVVTHHSKLVYRYSSKICCNSGVGPAAMIGFVVFSCVSVIAGMLRNSDVLSLPQTFVAIGAAAILLLLCGLADSPKVQLCCRYYFTAKNTPDRVQISRFVVNYRPLIFADLPTDHLAIDIEVNEQTPLLAG